VYLGGGHDCTARTGTVLHFEIGAVIDGKVNLIWSRGEASEWGKWSNRWTDWWFQQPFH